ncbi:polyketide cyclase [Bacterioplanes sanyensis]|uniref:Polyketide cyclase n=1 Tax=Bacterioplanes sanyensis TaxID=1249553 RepID=A0A222FHW1_9GAMM|nr:nuclear transport factor 2 family protein [Bacterioplanes sanyensis]ASP38349.1 polyketide cyclase [Bacterioplanes sanyensis]
MTVKEVVLAYWQSMQTNDYTNAADWLSDDFECHWPQSQEVICGKANFIALNSAYPSEGVWQFEIERLVAEGQQVVTDVRVSDGVRHDRAVTFHTVIDGVIHRQVEYWPDSYDAPAWRAQWVQNRSDK